LFGRGEYRTARIRFPVAATKKAFVFIPFGE